MARVRVEYVGPSDWRVISAQDLRDGHGIELTLSQSAPKRIRDAVPVPVGPNDLVWGPGVRAVLVDADDDLINILKGEGHFRIKEVTDSGETRVIVDAEDPMHEPDEIVDGRTGARSEVKK